MEILIKLSDFMVLNINVPFAILFLMICDDDDLFIGEGNMVRPGV